MSCSPRWLSPVAEELTAGAFLGPWRLMAIDGFDGMPPTGRENAAAFGFAGAGADDADRPAYPKVRVVRVSECASHAVVDAAMGGVAGKGAGEQALARKLYRRLDEDWLLIADRNFFNWADWCTAADSGAQLLWRVKADLTLPVLDLLPDGSYSSVLVSPKIRGKARQRSSRPPALAGPGRGPGPLRPGQSSTRSPTGTVTAGEVIALVTTITQMTAAPAPLLGRRTPSAGSMRPGTPSSRRTCAALGGCCGPRARTWCARKSTATCSPITPCRP